MDSVKKISINSVTASIIKNSLYFLVFFGVMVACIFPFITIIPEIDPVMATTYSIVIAALSTLIRQNSYSKYFLEYQRYRSYVSQMLLFYKYKGAIYLQDVQKWIDEENIKLKDRFLRDASFHLGIPQEKDGTIDLTKFYPQEPKKPKKNASAETLTQYQKDFEAYEEKISKFKVTFIQKRIVKRLVNKNYPRIPWKPSAILNVIGDADFYINRNVFSAEKVYRRTNAAFALIFSLLLLFFVGGIVIQARTGINPWAIAVQAAFSLFSIFGALIFGGIQGSKGGRKEEKSLITANGIFKQIKSQTLTEEEVTQYIKENQIVVVTEVGNKTEPLNIREVARLVVGELDIQDAKDQQGGKNG